MSNYPPLSIFLCLLISRKVWINPQSFTFRFDIWPHPTINEKLFDQMNCMNEFRRCTHTPRFTHTYAKANIQTNVRVNAGEHSKTSSTENRTRRNDTKIQFSWNVKLCQRTFNAYYSMDLPICANFQHLAFQKQQQIWVFWYRYFNLVSHLKEVPLHACRCESGWQQQ